MTFPEYYLIKGYYFDRRAKRSNVFLINHIEEGLAILDAIGASEKAKKAFCLHPIVQNNIDIDVSWSESYDLVCEYRDTANSYLCTTENDWIVKISDIDLKVPIMSSDCIDMLIADKVQNRKDFRLYHKDTHERTKQLEHYFDLWIEYLYYLKKNISDKNGL